MKLTYNIRGVGGKVKTRAIREIFATKDLGLKMKWKESNL